MALFRIFYRRRKGKEKREPVDRRQHDLDDEYRMSTPLKSPSRISVTTTWVLEEAQIPTRLSMIVEILETRERTTFAGGCRRYGFHK
jgi:hypothetical protein